MGGPRAGVDALFHSLTKCGRAPRVVGVDLRASEGRPSGWALLAGRIVEARLVKSDDEIVESTFTRDPDLVSIDSPLTLPKGRDCTSDRCECRVFGITRECERVLRRRGIPVFPCLIPSMQRLTERGVRLRERFEALGLRVIESYPGAAQDILGIARKKVSVEGLKRGLVELGLTGEFTIRKPRHDELDAITSALVGCFYLAGRYEALGNRDEGYLIIPRREGPEE